MANNENLSKAIYLKSTREWVPVSDEVYDEHRREIDAYIHRMRSHKCCRCPKSRWWLCDKDCWTCEFRCGSEFAPLDAPVGDEETEDITLGDTVADDAPSIDSIVCDKAELDQLFARLNQLMPEAAEIGKLRLAGLNDSTIADILGIKRTTFRSRLQKAKELLADEYPDCF